MLSCNDLGTSGNGFSIGFDSRMEIDLFGFGVVLYIYVRQAIAGLLRSIWFGRPILSFNDQGTTDTGFSNGFDSRMGIYLLDFGLVFYINFKQTLHVYCDRYGKADPYFHPMIWIPLAMGSP